MVSECLSRLPAFIINKYFLLYVSFRKISSSLVSDAEFISIELYSSVLLFCVTVGERYRLSDHFDPAASIPPLSNVCWLFIVCWIFIVCWLFNEWIDVGTSPPSSEVDSFLTVKPLYPGRIEVCSHFTALATGLETAGSTSGSHLGCKPSCGGVTGLVLSIDSSRKPAVDKSHVFPLTAF